MSTQVYGPPDSFALCSGIGYRATSSEIANVIMKSCYYETGNKAGLVLQYVIRPQCFKLYPFVLPSV